MPWIFPDEAYEMNTKGKKILSSSTVELNPEVGTESPWASHERQVAMDRVNNTKRAQLGMEGHLNTTARSQRYDRPASRSAVPNGVFHGSPMDYYTSGNAFRGGRIYTKEGQEWLARRLKERAGEFEAISSGNFSKGPPQPIAVSPYTSVDTLLSSIFAAFGSGSFTTSVATAVTQLLGEILKIGAVITPNQLTTYAQSIQKLVETIRGYRGGEPGVAYDRGNIEEQLLEGAPAKAIYNPAEERLRLVASIQTTLKLINGAIREIARTINDSSSARQQVMSILSQRLLGEQLAGYNPEFAGPERQAAVKNVPGVEMGVRTGPTLTGPTYGEIEQERQAEEQLIEEGFPQWDVPELAMNEGEAYAGQGKKRRNRRRKY